MSRLARWCFTHRATVITGWVLILAALATTALTWGTHYKDDVSLPGTDSARAYATVAAAFPAQAGDSVTVVWHTPDDATDTATSNAIRPVLADIAAAPHVINVTAPFPTTTAPAATTQRSPDGRTAYATVTFDTAKPALPATAVQHVVDIAHQASTDTVRIAVGGAAASNTPSGTHWSELIGLAVAALVLFFAFRSGFAMALPLATSIIALGGAMTTIMLLSHALAIPSVAPELTSLIGLGVGIDYALFVVTRHRTAIKQGATPADAIATALNTSGRAVLFAGITVCIALMGLFVTGVPFLYGLAIAASIGVLFTMAVTLTLLPALLGLLGTRVLSRTERAAHRARHRATDDLSNGWLRWSRFVERRPLITAAAALAIIAVLAVPFFTMRLGSADQGNDPATSSTRQAYDMLADGFGPGFNGPLLIVTGGLPVVAPGTAPPLSPGLTAIETSLRDDPGIAAVTPAIFSADGQHAIITAVPTTGPQDKATTDTLHRLRRDITATGAARALTVNIGGVTASTVDFAGVLTRSLPLFMAVVIGLSCLLLLVAFRSIAIPLKGAVMNLLAAASAFGVLVAIFQWGWFGDVIGIGAPGPIDAFLPVMLFAILFGLSMDYQVFLVARIQEEWLRTGDNKAAVRLGQAETGRVITAAAAIMVAVFVSFVFGGDRVIKMFGIGLASAIFLDAVVIRAVLVPASMQLLGRANWWLPRWLDRALPHLRLD